MSRQITDQDWRELRARVASWPAWWRAAVLRAAADAHSHKWRLGEAYGVLMGAVAAHADTDPEFAEEVEKLIARLWSHPWTLSYADHARRACLLIWRTAIEGGP